MVIVSAVAEYRYRPIQRRVGRNSTRIGTASYCCVVSVAPVFTTVSYRRAIGCRQ